MKLLQIDGREIGPIKEVMSHRESLCHDLA